MSIQAYENNTVETASQGELVLKLYNGFIKFIKASGKAMENNDIEKKNLNIQKAQRIVQELIITTDPSYDISQQILPLYEYMNRRLLEANTKNDREILDEVQGLAEEFRDTWKEVLIQTRKAEYSKGGNV
ncbi:flagellar export chaperone FliS [Salimicrobium salexigens]|uniref:Flagellar secretion chaperone FliS n=1 Tax=Salimicrobium salexigens TaxID=908941 RepID=A0ABY1KWP1_9BACI|nr:flagellar export chaperone FliS [Salimicrobium salexigens]SIS70388.1 flagellar protein FliS [Salimicrobium salexigens]